MTTKDLQRIDELIHVADMAVRVASQLRLWLKRNSLRDTEAVEEGVQFLSEAACGGRFVETGEVVAGSSSLYPLTWSADVQFGPAGQFASSPPPSVSYDELVKFLDERKSTLSDVLVGQQPSEEAVLTAAAFFDRLGEFLGGKADNALRSPAGGTQLLHDRLSYQ